MFIECQSIIQYDISQLEDQIVLFRYKIHMENGKSIN